MALRQLIATITVNPRQQVKVRETLRGFDTDLARDGLIAWEPRGFGYSQGLIIWNVIPIGARSAQQVKRRLATHLKSFDCEMEWKSLIDGYLYDVNMCNCKPPALLLHVGIVTRHEVIRCGGCRGLIALTSLPLSVELTQGLTSWAYDYHYVQTLWLGSGDYETWAAKQMDKPNSKLNVRGMSLAK